jgi:hypothetical protein
MSTKKRRKKMNNEQDLTPYRKKMVELFWGNNISNVYTYYETFKRPKEELLKIWRDQMIYQNGKKS